MTTADKIYEEVKQLSEDKVRQVLAFVARLRSASSTESKPEDESNATATADWAEFESAAGSWTGKFVRDDCYDRRGLR